METQTVKIPDDLKSTYAMLTQTFPNGICEEDYWAVLYLLYDDMSDRNLALVISEFTGKSLGIIVNDIYKVCQMEIDIRLLDKIKMKLNRNGFEDWKREED